ncbi:leucine-rich repeat neuronal protein 3-like [Colletes gigas]|uniref:leucine-rich repeat neuronal protein 3-like n=1 Tax=Colletes gigas TaxID=935657 RepID=UPI001C9B4970|nr:leucine-rich repeat neuronal protein 3-like [Colletes gigas]
MDHLLVFIFLFTFTSIKCESISPNVTTESNNTNSAIVEDKQTNETVTALPPVPKFPNVCNVCNCTGVIIDCKGKNLTANLEDSQWPNTTISTISFEGNLLDHVKAFPKIVVKKLILKENKITKLDRAAFKQLINLTELDLSHNELTSENLVPHAFEGKFSSTAYEPLENLTTLSLSYNKLHTIHQDLFEHMSNLRILNLSHNLFTHIDVRTSLAISSIQRLEELDLSYCGLKEIENSQFHTTTYLKKLDLSGNQFTIPPAALNGAVSLEYLYMDENPIKVIDHLNAFPSMSKLKELSLCCMPHLTTIEANSFSGLEMLEHLRVSNCPKLETIEESALTFQMKETKEITWPPLKKLDLSDNALEYLPQYLLVRWDLLEELDLTKNKWSCDCDNQYLIGELLPKYGKKLLGDNIGTLTCASPPEHAGTNLSSLSHRTLRCPDLYGARPERDAMILVGVMIGLMLAIPVCLAVFVFWRRGYFFCGTQGPASFSRAFYKRTANDDDM